MEGSEPELYIQGVGGEFIRREREGGERKRERGREKEREGGEGGGSERGRGREGET